MPLDQYEEEEENEMTFLDHLEELRWHIIRSLIAILVFSIAAFASKDLVFHTIILGRFAHRFLDLPKVMSTVRTSEYSTFVYRRAALHHSKQANDRSVYDAYYCLICDWFDSHLSLCFLGNLAVYKTRTLPEGKKCCAWS